MMDIFKKLFWKILFRINGFTYYPIGGGGGDDDEPQAAPFVLPGFAQGLPEEQLALIRSQIGKTVAAPGEFDIASQSLQGLLGISPDQFQFPLEAINQALDAQQAQQLQRFEENVNPLLAQRGQLDSTTRENQLGRFLSDQGTSRLGTTADLLTQQAQQNFQLAQFLPQFQSQIAGQLGGLGGQRVALDQFNFQIPQQQANALGGVFNQGIDLGQRRINQSNLQFQADLQARLAQQQQQSQLFQSLGSLGFSGITGGASGASGLLGKDVGFGGGFLQGVQGTSGQTQFLNQVKKLGLGNFSRNINLSSLN